MAVRAALKCASRHVPRSESFYLGDTLQGEATRIDGPGRRGIANAASARGVSAQCHYEISGTGMGTGSCSFSDGALYRLHFGG